MKRETSGALRVSSSSIASSCVNLNRLMVNIIESVFSAELNSRKTSHYGRMPKDDELEERNPDPKEFPLIQPVQ